MSVQLKRKLNGKVETNFVMKCRVSVFHKHRILTTQFFHIQILCLNCQCLVYSADIIYGTKYSRTMQIFSWYSSYNVK